MTLIEISGQLAGTKASEPLAEITEYLSTFKIALFIDNLETIMDDTIRKFVGSLPEGSKIIITSRIGLGAYEYPVKLSGIEEKYASELLRTLGRLRNIQALAKQDEAVLKRYVNRMHLNPGYIKWFVSALQTGQSPETVLQKSSLFLEFCMSNVYEYLSPDAREITAVLQCEPGWKDVPELHFLSGLEAIRIQKALQELMTTNMLSESSKPLGGSIKTTYQLADLARAYLYKHNKPPKNLQQRIQTNRNRLNSLVEKNNYGTKTNRYSFHNIKVRSKNDQIIFRRLRDAMTHIRNGNSDLAYEILEESQRLSPDYFEVPRILAYFNQKRGNFPEARDNYELAIALAPETPQLHLWFGKFILNDEQSVDDAVEQFEEAHKLDPESHEVSINLARGYMLQHNFPQVHKILKDVSPKIGSFADNIRGMFYDTTVQVHYREADDLYSSGQYNECITALQKMQNQFESLPLDMKNDYLRGKLSKASVILNRLAVRCHGTELTLVQNLLHWLGRESRARINKDISMGHRF